MIVVDTNVLAYALIQGDRTALALQVGERDPQWVVPLLWRYEFLNVLTTFARHGVLELAQATRVWERAQRLLLAAERPVSMPAALRLAVEHQVSAYDAQYLALARQLRVRCVTEDRSLLGKFPGVAVSMADFCT